MDDLDDRPLPGVSHQPGAGRAGQPVARVERRLLDRLRQLNADGLKTAVGDYLEPAQITTLLQRRDRIVAHFDAGGADLVFDRRAR